MTYASAKFEVATSTILGGDTYYKKIHYFIFELGVKVTQNVAQYPQHHVTHAPATFDVATSNGLGGDAFTRKYIILSLIFTLESRQ